MNNNKVELSNETLRRALEAANKEYPDKKDAFGKNQAFYLGVCHEAERSQKLDKEIEALQAENSKMRKALQETQALARRGIFPGMPVEVLGAQMCIDINKLVTKTLKKDSI